MTDYMLTHAKYTKSRFPNCVTMTVYGFEYMRGRFYVSLELSPLFVLDSNSYFEESVMNQVKSFLKYG